MKLWAISDLHIGVMQNRDALRDLSSFPEDWLILAGDVCESIDDLAQAFAWCVKKFARVREVMNSAILSYANEVKGHRFPTLENSYQ